MSTTPPSTSTVFVVSAIGAAVGTITTLVAVNSAFKVPKNLRKYLPKNDTETAE